MGNYEAYIDRPGFLVNSSHVCLIRVDEFCHYEQIKMTFELNLC